MTILFDHDEFLFRSDRDDVHPIDAIDHKEIVRLFRSGRNLAIRADREDPEISHRF
jgi:hypothetical protein